MLKYFLVLTFITFQAQAWTSDYSELARTRKYIGGVDEDDLKVQSVLYQYPNKKKKKVKVEPGEGF